MSYGNAIEVATRVNAECSRRDSKLGLKKCSSGEPGRGRNSGEKEQLARFQMAFKCHAMKSGLYPL